MMKLGCSKATIGKLGRIHQSVTKTGIVVSSKKRAFGSVMGRLQDPMTDATSNTQHVSPVTTHEFHSTCVYEKAAFAVPDLVVDDLDARNFGYRVVEPPITSFGYDDYSTSNTAVASSTIGATGASYDEDYDEYSLHMTPQQVHGHSSTESSDDQAMLTAAEIAAVHESQREWDLLTNGFCQFYTPHEDTAHGNVTVDADGI